MSKKGTSNVFILLLLIFSVAVNSFSAASADSRKENCKKEISCKGKEGKKNRQEVKAGSGFDAVIPFAGIELGKYLVVLSSNDYYSDKEESFNVQDTFKENKFLKTLFCFFIAKKGP
jgi:hypothetical protein